MKRWEALTTHGSLALIALSGVVYGAMKYVLAGRDPDSPLGHPWQPDVLKVHLLAAPFVVFAIGMLFRSHALIRLRRGEREGRRSGLTLLSLAAPLILSGYVLQALTGEAARTWTGYSHTAAGIVLAVGYAVHARQRSSGEEGEGGAG